MPKNMAGKVHSHTRIMIRFRSRLSRTCAVVRVSSRGRYRKVSAASYSGYSFSNRLPL